MEIMYAGIATMYIGFFGGIIFRWPTLIIFGFLIGLCELFYGYSTTF